MFSRPVLRAVRVARVARPAFSQAARANLTTGARFREPVPEVVAAHEVPTTTYADGHLERSTLTVDQNLKDTDSLGPLSQNVYNQLPPTMQKMSLMNKVVVVTGYVPCPNSRSLVKVGSN
jgi:hypothetical protein